MKSPPAILGALLPIGGLIAIAGGAWGYSDVSGVAGLVGAVPGASIGVGYGIYLCIVGGILALIAALGLRRK